MRKRVIFLVLFIMLVTLASAETKLSMELWNRWTYKMVDGANEASTNELSFQRGYLRLEPVFSSNIKGRFNLDFFSSDVPDDGAGLKLKYAYLDFSNYLWQDATFTFGLMKNYFGTIYDWAYETIEKDPADKYKFASSTDYGLGISGYIPGGYGEYQVAAYNGEGYKKTGSDIDTNMAYLLNVRVSPVTGLTLGGSYCLDTIATHYDYYNAADSIDVMVDYDETVNKIAAVGRLTMIPEVDIRAQYLTRTETTRKWDNGEIETDKTITAISVIPIVNLANLTNIDMELVLRYDMYDDNADVDDDAFNSGAYDTMTGGINYYILRDGSFNPRLWVQANYQMKNYIYKEKDDESELLMQLRWVFSETIK